MKTGKKKIEKLKVQSSASESEEEKLDGHPVSGVVIPKLVIFFEENDEDEKESIELPRVRFIAVDCNDSSEVRPYGPDRAKTWKLAGEWIRDLFIASHPEVEEKKYQNRLKAEEAYFHNKEDPEFYNWQEDEELLEEVRPGYERVKTELVDLFGRPDRSDYDRLYPHQYDDPGLSERGRRTVRDLRAIFGSDIVTSL